jgi:hypothetical protein
MTIKQYKAIKVWLTKIEKEIRDEAFRDGESPLDVEKVMPEALAKVLEAKGINPEEYFKLDKQMDKKTYDQKEAEDKEIDLESLSEDNEEEDVKEKAKGLIASILSKFKKSKK